FVAIDALGKSGEILDDACRRQQTAWHGPGQHERVQIGRSRVNGRRQPRASRANDHDLFHKGGEARFVAPQNPMHSRLPTQQPHRRLISEPTAFSARTARAPFHSQRLRARIAPWLLCLSLIHLAALCAEPPAYEQREPSRDGTGRVYLGREIAHVMGHQGAPWLERPERIEEERPDLLHALLGLKPGMTVADIGAGTGYHSWRMARMVGSTGRVLAVDIQPEMLSLLETNMTRPG